MKITEAVLSLYQRYDSLIKEACVEALPQEKSYPCTMYEVTIRKIEGKVVRHTLYGHSARYILDLAGEY